MKSQSSENHPPFPRIFPILPIDFWLKCPKTEPHIDAKAYHLDLHVGAVDLPWGPTHHGTAAPRRVIRHLDGVETRQ